MAEVTRLRLRVLDTGLPAYLVARQSGVPYSKLSRWMTGSSELPRKAAVTLSTYLRCEPCEVLGWVDLGRVLSMVGGSS
jgi:hypothetical protein